MMSSATPEVLRKFGRYFLLDLIAQGGMAEVYRARDSGGRLLAIKRIIPSYSQNTEFVLMFRTEITTTSGFTHPNIVQVYDYGEEQGMLYIAMELIDGKTLRQYIGRIGEQNAKFPIEVSVYIVEQAAHALNYAHHYKDKITGKSLNIVHRDISPQNIIISYDGAVKLIDFGIAKAVTNVESTRSGVIKGKPSYLSPEQISGDVLDGRSDVFALGIVLWELLAGRKLFTGDNDYAVLKLIESCGTSVKSPSLYNPDVPKDLDAIVMKCLQKNRDNRYSSADEMQRALHRFLYQFSSDFNPADLTHFARNYFKDEIVEDRKRLLRLNDKAEQLLKNQPPESQPKSAVPVPPPPDPTQTSQNSSTQQVPQSPPKPEENTKRMGSFRVVTFSESENTISKDLKLDGQQKSVKPTVTSSSEFTHNSTISRPISPSTQEIHRPQKSGAPLKVAIALLAIGAGGYFFYVKQMDADKPLQNANINKNAAILSLQSNVKAASITINGKQVASSFPTTLKQLPIGQILKIEAQANGYQKATQELTLTAGENKTIQLVLQREDGSAPTPVVAGAAPGEGASGTILLRLDVSPPGGSSRILLNGNPVDSLSAVASAPLDALLELVVEREGFRTYRHSFRIDSTQAAGKKEWPVEVRLEPAKFGYLSVKTTPSAEAIINIDGREERIATPFSRHRIPVGSYSVKLVNTLLGMEKEISITIIEDQFTNIEERLSVQGDAGVRLPSSH